VFDPNLRFLVRMMEEMREAISQDATATGGGLLRHPWPGRVVI
jgi:hypothetical protein